MTPKPPPCLYFVPCATAKRVPPRENCQQAARDADCACGHSAHQHRTQAGGNRACTYHGCGCSDHDGKVNPCA